MTTTVKGAGRARAAGRARKQARADQRLAEVQHDQDTAAKREEEVKRVVSASVGSSEEVLHPKVAAFESAAREEGWEVTARIDDDGAQHLDCKRGDELLHIFWLNGVYQKWATHKVGDSAEKRVQNAKSGLRVLGASPEEVRAATAKAAASRRVASSGKRRRPAEAGTEIPTAEAMVAQALAGRPAMVWDEQEMSEDEILDFLQGRQITWVNTLTGSVTSARIPKAGRHNKIDHGKAGPAISFAAMEGPFMTAALCNIIKVS